MQKIHNKIFIKSETREVYKEKKFIGTLGENNIEKLVFSFLGSKFIDGVAWLEVKKPSGTKGCLQMNKVDNTYELAVLSSLLDEEGHISLQLRITETEDIESPLVFKSEKFDLQVKDAINAAEEIEEQYPTFVDFINTKVDNMEKRVEEIEKHGGGSIIWNEENSSIEWEE